MSNTQPADAPHIRQTRFDPDKGSWHWCDEEREACEQPPLVVDVLRDKLAEHGLASVWPLIGLARNTCLALAAGAPTHMGTMLMAQASLHKLAKLDSGADYRLRKSLEAKASK